MDGPMIFMDFPMIFMDCPMIFMDFPMIFKDFPMIFKDFPMIFPANAPFSLVDLPLGVGSPGATGDPTLGHHEASRPAGGDDAGAGADLRSVKWAKPSVNG